jgi:hypothetical protein
MKELLTILILAAMAVPGWSDEVAVLIDAARPGAYLVVVEPDRSISVSPVTIVRPRASDQQPTNSNGSPPEAPTAFEKVVAEQTRQVLAAGGAQQAAEQLAGVYESVARQVTEGRIKPDQAAEAIRRGSDAALSDPAERARWASFRTSLSNALSTLHAQGHLQTSEQLAEVLLEIASGMNAAIEPSK